MNITCPLTGVSYTVSGIQGTAVDTHPILLMSARTLNNSYLADFAENKLSSEQIHLIGMAYIMKLPITMAEDWKCPSVESLHAFWLQQLERIARIATRVETYGGKRALPTFNLTTDSFPKLVSYAKTLEAVMSGKFLSIDGDTVRKLNAANFKKAQEAAANHKPEDNLHLLEDAEITDILLRGLRGSILDSHDSKVFPHLMADWACKAGNFPTTKISNGKGEKLSLCELWRKMIVVAFRTTDLRGLTEAKELAQWELVPTDVETLIEQCYEDIEPAGIHAEQLFAKLKVLKNEIEDLKNLAAHKKAAAKKPSIAKDISTADLLDLLGDDEPEQAKPEQAKPAKSKEQMLAMLAKLGKK